MSCANLVGGLIPLQATAVSQGGLIGQTTLGAGTSPAIAIPYLKSTDVVILQAIGALGVANSACLGAVVANSGLVNATLTISSFDNLDTRVVNYAVIKTA